MFLKKTTKSRLFFLVALLCACALFIAGCSGASRNTGGDSKGDASRGSFMSGSPRGETAAGEEAQERPAGENRTGPRFVIRTGSLDLIVADVRQTMAEVERLTADSGGIVSESNLYEVSSEQYACELSLRVPEDRFDSFIARMEELGEAADIRKGSEDVTLTYLDLETRIENLQAEERRLREILTEASSVDDILKVEQELFRVRGEIETMTTEFTYLQDRVALSTIKLRLREKPMVGQTISQKPFANMGERLKEAFFRSINFIFSAAAFVLVALTALLPVLTIVVLIILAVVGVIRTLRRRKGVPSGGQPPDF